MTVPSFVARSVFAVMVVAIVVTCMQAQVVAAPSTGLQFYPAAPCRVVDTRNPNGPLGGPPIQGGTSRSFPIPQSVCNIPSNAGAYVFTVTAIPEGQLTSDGLSHRRESRPSYDPGVARWTLQVRADHRTCGNKRRCQRLCQQHNQCRNRLQRLFRCTFAKRPGFLSANALPFGRHTRRQWAAGRAVSAGV